MTTTTDTSDAAEQVAVWALNLSMTIEDAISEWRENEGCLTGETMTEMSSHKKMLDIWLSQYDQAAINKASTK